MPPSGSMENQATSGDALPRDVLASVLLRFRASDLRRFRRVCKEWCEVISDPAFVQAHIVHGPRALSHTIVFVVGCSEDESDIEPPRSGEGYLFDEHWRLVARFTAGESEDMVGTCNGLICFLDCGNGGIRVVEPFTGESLVLPTPNTQRCYAPGAYCFGFDPSLRRYKVFHQGREWHNDDSTENDLYVYTIGGDENWRRAHVADVSYYRPVFADGAVWSIDMNQHQLIKVGRFDLATEEEITSEHIELVNSDRVLLPMITLGSDGEGDEKLYVVDFRHPAKVDVFFRKECGRWTEYSTDVTLPSKRFPAWPHPLQRRHLLLEDHIWNSRRAIYAHPFAPGSNDMGVGKLLLEILKDEIPSRCNDIRWVFVPVPCEEEMAARVKRIPQESVGDVRVFCYAPPVFPSLMARYLF